MTAPSHPVSIRFPAALWHALTAAATAEGTTPSALVKRLATLYVRGLEVK